VRYIVFARKPNKKEYIATEPIEKRRVNVLGVESRVCDILCLRESKTKKNTLLQNPSRREESMSWESCLVFAIYRVIEKGGEKLMIDVAFISSYEIVW